MEWKTEKDGVSSEVIRLSNPKGRDALIEALPVESVACFPDWQSVIPFWGGEAVERIGVGAKRLLAIENFMRPVGASAIGMEFHGPKEGIVCYGVGTNRDDVGALLQPVSLGPDTL